MNALTKFAETANLPSLSNEEMAAALAESNAEHGSSGGTMDFLSFSGKTGAYSLGRDRSGMDPEELYLLDMRTFMEGWICWKSNKPVARVEWSVYHRKQQAVAFEDLEDHGPYRSNMGEGWQEVMGFGVLPMADGDNKPIKFTTSSTSGRNAVVDLRRQVEEQLHNGEPTFALLSFDSEEFVAQEQRNFKPKFVIDAWVTPDAVEAFYDGGLSLDDLIAGKAPKKKRATRKKG